MRLRSTLFFIFLAFFLCYTITLVQPAHAVTFSQVTTYYTISGELCYANGGFTGSQAISGELLVTLTPMTGNTVKCESTGYVEENLLVEDRQQADGNYTPFFINLPAQARINITTFTKNVVSQYVGDRYLEVEGKSVHTHFYCYIVNEIQSILRFEWYFEYGSGILLKFFKAIDLNFVRVQWEEYMAVYTTRALTGAHPVTAFFTNIRENFFAIVGALVTVILCFYYLTQRKLQRGETL